MNEFKESYHKTGQYRNAIMRLKGSTQGLVNYSGGVKLHGTNASIIQKPDGTISFHSKNNKLASVDTLGVWVEFSDNAGFVHCMRDKINYIRELMKHVRDIYRDKEQHVQDLPVKVTGEWCGPGVQKGVGISGIENKSLFLFNVDIGGNKYPYDTELQLNYEGQDIYNLRSFRTEEVTVDLNFPQKASVEMEKLVNEYEETCPVAKQLGVLGSLTGEGLVWTPTDADLYKDTGTWFKTKGQKHSSSKVKKLVSHCPEKVKDVEEFVSYAVTPSRLEQGLQEIGLDIKNTGKFIGWVNRDIFQEESDTLTENDLTMKDVGSPISTIARGFFIKKVNETL